eukprot:5630241-Pyramimonas_sp.AAC.1
MIHCPPDEPHPTIMHPNVTYISYRHALTTKYFCKSDRKWKTKSMALPRGGAQDLQSKVDALAPVLQEFYQNHHTITA